jgi:uncharacterized protein YjiS (DUF1127 family)
VDFPKHRNVRNDPHAPPSEQVEHWSKDANQFASFGRWPKPAKTKEMIMSTISNAMLGRNTATETLAGIGRNLKRWWIAYMHWRIERAAADRLFSMSDRELKDIGLNRSGVPGALREAARDHAISRNY